ncbi:MAG: hypothetical protein HYV25_03225 [Candidatus Harrisonbacteria bacterium]|nr:hypothetical protein [Candidatus Harrisonbacteria bacterium]
MIEHLRLIRLQGNGNPDVLEQEDVDAAVTLVHHLRRWAVQQYRERCMKESFPKKFARHTVHLAEQLAAHMERVLEHGNALVRHILAVPAEKQTEEKEKTLARQMREIEFALLMHECAKLNPESAGGVNPDAHLEETCRDALAFLADFRRKRKPLAERMTAMVEVSGSSYSTYAKRTGVRTPATVEEAIVFAAVNLDAVDFWGAHSIVWIRQHPHRREMPERATETVGASLAFAKRMRDDAANAVCGLQLRKMHPSALGVIYNYGAAYWKRSGRFFAFFEERPPATFMEFRGGFNEFLRRELEHGNLGWCVSRRGPLDSEQGS